MSARHVWMLALLSAIWGASYLLIKYAIRDFSPPMVVFGRTALAAVALLGVILLQGGTARAALVDLRRRPGSAFFLGLVAIAAPFLLITYGERAVPSGLTAVLIASAPIFIALLAPHLDRSEVMAPVQWAGLLLGLVGVGLLVGVESIHTVGAFLGAMAMIGAAACYALSGFVLKGRYSGFPPIVTSLFSIGTSAVLTLPAAAAQPPTDAPGGLAILSVVLLGLGGTAFAFVIYYRLIGEIGYGRSSIIAYTIPPVSLLYGAALLDESITPAMIGGLALILAGVFLITRGGARAPATPQVPAEASSPTRP